MEEASEVRRSKGSWTARIAFEVFVRSKLASRIGDLGRSWGSSLQNASMEGLGSRREPRLRVAYRPGGRQRYSETRWELGC